jgi:hypothetical protein
MVNAASSGKLTIMKNATDEYVQRFFDSYFQAYYQFQGLVFQAYRQRSKVVIGYGIN